MNRPRITLYFVVNRQRKPWRPLESDAWFSQNLTVSRTCARELNTAPLRYFKRRARKRITKGRPWRVLQIRIPVSTVKARGVLVKG